MKFVADFPKHREFYAVYPFNPRAIYENGNDKKDRFLCGVAQNGERGCVLWVGAKIDPMYCLANIIMTI